MTQLLLQTGFMDSIFTMKDVIYILILLGGAVGGYVKFIQQVDKLKAKDDAHDKELLLRKEETAAVKKEFEEFKTDQRNRDDRQDKDMKEITEKQNRFQEELIKVLSEVKLGMSELKSELKQDFADLKLSMRDDKK